MPSEQLENSIATMLTKLLEKDISTTRLDARLIEDYDADSMDMVDIADRIETVFDIQVSNNDVPGLKTFGDVVNYVRAKLPTDR